RTPSRGRTARILSRRQPMDPFSRARARIFRDRRAAGRELGERLAHAYASSDPIVLALPRGGVPVAYEVARALRAPLDVLVVRKIGAPFNREFAIGAIASGGVTVYHDDVLAALGLDRAALAGLEA